MLVILEGIDCGGKSSLAVRLSERTDGKILHRGPIQEHPLVEYELDIDDGYRPGEGDTIICDRWHWGELVYGPVFRDRIELYPAAWLHIELFLLSRGAIVVHLDPPRDTVLARMRGRGEDKLQPGQVEDVLRRYDHVSRDSLLPVIRLRDDVDEHTLRVIIRQARQHEDRATELGEFPTYIGHWHPQRLLLGEKRGPTPAQERHSTAFAPYPATSGAYLLDALLDVELGCGIANSWEEDVPALWQRLGKPRIVTLGRKAHEAVDLPHGAVPHPQYVRRFHYGAQHGYANLIKTTFETQEDMLAWRPSR